MKLVTCIVIAAVSMAHLSAAAEGESVSVELVAPTPQIEQLADGTRRVSIDGMSASVLPGNPNLPSRDLNILVPPDIDWSTLTLRVEGIEQQALPGTFDVAPARPDTASIDGQVITSWCGVTNIVDGRNMDIYAADAPFPAQPVTLRPYSQIRKWRFVRLRFAPVQVNPVRQELTVTTRATAVLEFARRTPSALDTALLADSTMDVEVAGMFENSAAADTWYAPPPDGPEVNVDVDYAIITTDAIEANSTELANFVTHKEARGYGVAIVTESDFGGLTGQAPDGRAEKIRKWLQDNYVSMDIEYVLLVGDPTPGGTGATDIPMKKCWPRRDEATDRDSPTDMFFADLTGDWDPDNDQIYGEWSDYDTAGGVDLGCELYVGRIPVYNNDYAELDTILTKIMAYENQSVVAWRESILMPMSYSELNYDGAILAEQMWDDFLNARTFSRWRQYQQGTAYAADDSIYASDEELRGGNVVRNRWRDNDYGIVCWWAHGSSTAAGVGYSGHDDGTLFDTSMTGVLDNNHPSFTYQCSCLNGYPENTGNLQYELLVNGTIAAVSATRVSWYNDGVGYGQLDGSSVNAGIGYEYVDRLSNNYKCGKGLRWAKWAVTGDIGTRNTRLMNQYDFGVYGCPAVGIENTEVLKPDLRPSSAAASVSGGTEVTINTTIRNDSSLIASGYSYVGYYLSQNQIISTTDHRIGSDYVMPLSPLTSSAEGIVVDVRNVLPAIPAGTYYIGVLADYGDIVDEEDEFDNDLSTDIQVTVPSPPPPPSGVAATDGVYTDRIRVTWNPAARATHYRVYRNTSSDSGSATAVSWWQTSTTFNDTSATTGRRYYYWVRSATSSSGHNESGFSSYNSGYVLPHTLSQDVKVTASGTPSHYRFLNTDNIWMAVGVRYDVSGENWSMGLYSGPDFNTALGSSTYNHPVDFMVVDSHHVSKGYYGLEAYRYAGTGSASVEFEAGSDVLSVGTNDTYLWTAGDVVEAFDLPLDAGTYVVELRYTGGTAELDVALFSSTAGVYYKNRVAYLGRSINSGTADEQFYVTVPETDDYGLVVWANTADAANYYIVVTPLQAGLWDGDVSSNWHTSANWNDGQVPDASVDVTIPPGTPYECRVYTADAYCNNLSVQAGATLNIDPAALRYLYAAHDVHIAGHLNMGTTHARLSIGHDMFWESGSTANDVGSARFIVDGDWNFESGADIQLDSSYAEFTGTQTSWIRTYESRCNLHNLNANKSGGANLNVSNLCVEELHINNLYLYNGCDFYILSQHPVVVNGFFNNVSGGDIYGMDGTFVYAGNAAFAPMKPNAGNYFNNLIIRSDTEVQLDRTYADTLDVRGDLIIESSRLNNTAGIHIDVRGDWSNGVGTAGYVCGTSTVALVGTSGDQTIMGNSTFYKLTDARGPDGRLIVAGQTTVADTYTAVNTNDVQAPLTVNGTLDLNDTDCVFNVHTGIAVSVANVDLGGRINCYGGSFVAGEIVDSAIVGGITLTGGTVDMSQAMSPGNYLGLGADINISGGSLMLRGGSPTTESWWPNFGDCDLTMTDGVLDFTDTSINLQSGGIYTFSHAISGGRIRTAKGFIGERTDFHPTGGTLELYGTATGDLAMGTGSHVHNLEINKAGGVQVTAISNVVAEGDITVFDGSLVAPPLIEVGGNWSNAVGDAGFDEGVGTVSFVGSGLSDILSDETFYDLDVDKLSGSYTALEIAEGHTVHARSDLDIRDGSFEINSGCVLDVDDDIFIRADAGLNINDYNVTLNLGDNWYNYNTNASTYVGCDCGSSSTINFDGSGNQQELYTYEDSLYFHDVTIDNVGGGIQPYDPMYVGGDAHVINGAWILGGGGFTHDFADDLIVEAGGAWEDHSAGATARFAGRWDSRLAYHGASGGLPNITVDKSEGLRVRLDTDVTTDGDGRLTVVEGEVDLDGNTLAVVGGAEVQSGGLLDVPAGSALQIANGLDLVVMRGGTLSVVGVSRDNATIEGMRAARYTFDIKVGGTIRAEHATFRDMASQGVTIAAGATIDPTHAFHYCTFDHAYAGSIFLSVNNDQRLDVYRASFPTNPGGGSYNVYKPNKPGGLRFIGAMGSFAGEAYDQDPYGNVDWHSGAITHVGVATPPTMTRRGGCHMIARINGDLPLEPFTYRWAVTDNAPAAHAHSDHQDIHDCAWNTTGSKTVTVTVDNEVGSATGTCTVAVEDLRIRSDYMDTSMPEVGLTLQGTSTQCMYRVLYCTDLEGGDWVTATPDGGSITGGTSETPWTDHGEPVTRDLDTLDRVYYRAKLLP